MCVRFVRSIAGISCWIIRTALPLTLWFHGWIVFVYFEKGRVFSLLRCASSSQMCICLCIDSTGYQQCAMHTATATMAGIHSAQVSYLLTTLYVQWTGLFYTWKSCKESFLSLFRFLPHFRKHFTRPVCIHDDIVASYVNEQLKCIAKYCVTRRKKWQMKRAEIKWKGNSPWCSLAIRQLISRIHTGINDTTRFEIQKKTHIFRDFHINWVCFRDAARMITHCICRDTHHWCHVE